MGIDNAVQPTSTDTREGHDWDSVWLPSAKIAVAACSCGWYQIGDNPRGTHRGLAGHLAWPKP